MSDNIRALRQVTSWSAAVRAIDWTHLSGQLDIAFPDEYKALVEAFPPGEFQTFIKVLHPEASSDADAFREEVAGYAAIVADWAAEQPLSYPVYPAVDGLIPWAIVGFDYVFCWRPGAGGPDTWPTIVCNDDEEPWPIVDLPTAAVLNVLVTDRSGIEEMRYIAEHVQPPDFTPLRGFEPDPAEPVSRPSGQYWVSNLRSYAPTILETVPVDGLAPVVEAVAVPGYDISESMMRAKHALPGDYYDIVTALGAVTAGPARLCAPDGSVNDFFAVGKALGDRVAAERNRGGGPPGAIDPEAGGLIPWGRLGGGYLGWARTSGNPHEWPVVALDASLGHHVAYPMSTSRFLYELATNPDGVVLPPVR